MSIRNVLIGVMAAVTTAAIVVVSAIGTVSIHHTVVREAQARVHHDLDTAIALYQQQLSLLGQRLQYRQELLRTQGVSTIAPARLQQWKRALGFTVLNLCEPDGRPLAGAYPRRDAQVPVRDDPVLRRALGGSLASGTVLLDERRLELEGGAALRNLVAVPSVPNQEGTGTTAALFRWFALPLQDKDGRVTALLYGGQALNHDYALVDNFRSIVFTSKLYEGKPLGTVTVFLDRVRVATNVLGPRRRRAVGTVVSDEVRDAVLRRGQRWRSRAWVVDAWYLSSYEPLRDPDGRILGMLYVGLLEAPYNALRNRLGARFLLPAGALLVVGILGVALVVRRITHPLHNLRDSAERIANGDWDSAIAPERTYTEIAALADSFHTMQGALRDRDQQLRDQNRALADTNDQLERANRNYMQTLGFVTHELSAPLAAMQSHIDLLLGGYVGEVPEKATRPLTRIKRNCEELRDMVKNYLDLSRAEQGELATDKRPIDLITDVVRTCVDQNQALFDSRQITLETHCPDKLPATADPDLLRIVLTNYLSNAAKYGREGGTVRLEVAADRAEVVVSVWNDGAGFTKEEAERLFQKFSRLRNWNTADKRGSGLGLWLCQQLMELHGGTVAAESEPGQWARFSLCFPVAAP